MADHQTIVGVSSGIGELSTIRHDATLPAFPPARDRAAPPPRRGFRRRSAVAPRGSWAYPAETSSRDRRIDILRGMAALFVIVDHIRVNSVFYLVSHERIGMVTGAELFVMFSGIVLGLVHRRRAIEDGWKTAADRIWARALLLYLTCLGVMVVSYLTGFLPLFNGDVLTTWTDEATATTHAMYGSTPLLADYPVPAGAVLDIVFLNVGPYQFNVIGLYVVLLLLAPIVLRLLLSGKWWIVLGLSWSLYAAALALNVRIFSSQFENQFPLLAWQVLFFSGITVGFYWKSILAWFDRPLGRSVALLSFALYAGFLFFAWNNPALDSDPFGLRFHVIPDETFQRVYDDFFRRDFLGFLRIANVAAFIVTAYAVLTWFWAPFNKGLGWLLIPLGGASLYVFIMHLVFALIAGSLPVLADGTLLLNSIAHAVIILVLWLMVKRRVLFRWIPR